LLPLLATPGVRRGIEVLSRDRFFLAFFLVSVSQGEGLGAAAVGIIGHEEVAQRIRDIRRQREEEASHEARTLSAARRHFPEYFVDGRYRFTESLQGRPYYLAVLEANRSRLEALGRYSLLNPYLTTSFGYEVMVLLLYQAVAGAVAGAATLPEALRQEISSLLHAILDEEETHLGIVAQHDGLLATDRSGLSSAAVAALRALELLGVEDYAFSAELAVRQLQSMMERLGEPAAYRAAIEAGRTGGH